MCQCFKIMYRAFEECIKPLRIERRRTKKIRCKPQHLRSRASSGTVERYHDETKVPDKNVD